MTSLALRPHQRQLAEEDFFLDFGGQTTAPSSPAHLFGRFGGLVEDFDMEDPTPNPFNTYGNPEQLNCVPAMFAPMPPLLPVPVVLPMQLLQKPQRRRITVLAHDEPSKKSEEEFLLCNPDIRPGHVFDKDFNDSLFINSNVPLNEVGQSLMIPGFENDYLFMEDFDEAAEEEDVSDDDDDDENCYHVDDLMNVKLGNVNFANLNNLLALPPQEYEEFEYVKPEVHDVIPDDMSLQFEMMQVDDEDPQVATPEDTPTTSPDAETVSPKRMTRSFRKGDDQNHYCDVINPATGERCSKHFSRPYDLIRHQETIHARKKRIFRCVICEGRENGGLGNGKSKTFSRGDALSRHIKVKHHLVGQDAVKLINKAKENVEYVSA